MRAAWAGLLLGAALLAGPAVAAPAPDAARLARLQAEVIHGEDLSAIKKLNRSYGYYLDAGLWDDLADLFADDAVANYPNGVWVGRKSIREHLIQNLGGGKIGLGEGRIYTHMPIQPVVHLDPGGRTAKGRWRAFAMMGRFGGGANWAEGVYEMGYVKDGGVWKIATLDYYNGFGAPYEGGWAKVAPAPKPGDPPGPRRRIPLAYPPDRPKPEDCPGYPVACVGPFHYKNLGSGGVAAAAAWPDEPVAGAPAPDLADLTARAERLADEQEVENLVNIYGYYLDHGQWDQLADLFASNGTIELGQQGVYVGKKRVRQFLETLGPNGGKDGWMFDHIQEQPVVNFTPQLGYARGHELAMTGVHQQSGQWSEGVYENVFVKQNGVWKIRALRYFPVFIADYDKGWGKDAQPAPGPSQTLPPDRPPTEVYEIYPKAHVVRFHYTHPVTGKAPHYPGGAEPAATVSVPTGPAKTRARPDLAAAEQTMARVKAFHELENLEDAYGYYLDKNLWDDLADLFAADGTMELAQRGVYVGRERVRAFLKAAFGPSGPQTNRLGNHIQLQPVIHVAPDAKTAKVRLRMLQQLGNAGGRGNWGGAVYENEMVVEDGVWKFKTLHAWNTFGATYEGGWTKSSAGLLPGPSKTLPPDKPPSATFTMFPKVYTPPFHYSNPVTGRK